ncbi:MAG: chemotaxis protein CheB, partial [archaeon]|nr:chemotaxis protein CheB [archaeon]
MTINIIIVDDSKFMRVALEKVLSKRRELKLLNTFRSGIDALEYLKSHEEVDAILLDCFMPKMDGIETLQNIMKIRPTPTIMLTIANKTEHADIYFNALKYGAFDIIPKPSGLNSLYIEDVEEIIVDKLQLAVKSRPKLMKLKSRLDKSANIAKMQNEIHMRSTGTTLDQIDYSTFLYKYSGKFEKTTIKPQKYKPKFKLLVIGASTGGPPVVSDVIENVIFNPNVAILIIQHMPSTFTSRFARRLNTLTDYTIVEAKDGMIIKPGYGYVAPGGLHMEFIQKQKLVVVKTNSKPKVHAVRPAIDVTLPSIAEIFRNNVMYMILTGMGNDGSINIHLLKRFGGITLAQDPNEALIDSMPVKSIKTGMVD